MNKMRFIEYLIKAIVYDKNSDIDQIYKDLRTIRNLKTINRSDHPKAYKVRDELEMFISYYNKIFKSKTYVLEIEGDYYEKEFYMTIGDDEVWESYDCCKEAIEAGAMEIISDRLVCRISGADLVKYGIADVSEIVWNILWSGVTSIKVVDAKTGKTISY